MSTALCVRRALPAAALWAETALLATLVACGGGGMGSAPTSMPSDVMGSGSMASGSTDMSCMGMNMSMSCPAPTIALMAPAGTLSRTVALRAHVVVANGDAVARVDFMVDGVRVGMASIQPFAVNWDSTTVSDGTHALTASVSDGVGQTSSASPVTLQVDNHPGFTVALSPAQIVPAPTSAGSATAHLTVDLGTGVVSGNVLLSGLTATAVTLNEAFAGNTGPILLSFSPGASGTEWQLPPGALLTTEQVTSLLQGGLYAVVSTAANSGGELRGQIAPTNVLVIFSALSGAQEVPAVAIDASGVAATTIDTQANTLTVDVHATGVDDALAAEVDEGAVGATGPRLAALTRDDIDPGHWSTQLIAVSASDIDTLKAGNGYINVMTSVDPRGAIRGQIEVIGD